MEGLMLITGVTGYIGFKTLIQALEVGLQVRAIVRKAERATKLQSHPKIAPHAANVEWAIIHDLADTSSLISKLADVTGILHLASPLASETDDYDRDIVDPAIKITLSILNAAHVVPSVKRVVLTSSATTLVPYDWMYGPRSTPDLTLFTPENINTNPRTLYRSSMEAYFASKALTRLATHDFIASHQPSFEFVILLPAVALGPDELATSAADLMVGTRTLVLGPIQEAQFPEMVGAMVHVNDVARAHVDALKPSIPGNKTYILSSDAPEGIIWEDMKIIVKREFPTAVESGVFRLRGSIATRKWRLDTSETEKAFGWKCTSFDKTVKELVGQYLSF